MKVKTWIPLVLAIVLGLFAAKLTRDSISRGRNNKNEDKMVTTVVTTRDIEPGTKLTAADLVAGKASGEAAPAGAFTQPADALDRVVTTRLVKGQMVFDSLLAPVGTGAGVQALIPEGMRAITIQVNEFSGLAGMLVPGCKVDIISVIRGDNDKSSVARTIVQAVEIRAVGRQVSPQAASVAAAPPDPSPGAPPVPTPNNVTLLVTPAQAEQIQLATVGGPAWLVLRNAKDEENFESEGVTLADLRGDARRNPLDGENDTKLTATSPDAKPADPFAGGKGDASSFSSSSRTRIVKIIRNTKEESLTVNSAPEAPANSGWLNAQNDERSAVGDK